MNTANLPILRMGIRLATAGLLTLSLGLTTGPAAAEFPELGDAANFSVLGLGRPSPDAVGGDGRVDFANATVFGDVGVGPYGTLDFEGPAVLDGDLYLDPLIKNFNTDNGTVLGTIYDDVDLSGAVSSALDAAETYGDMLPDQVFSKVESTQVIYGNGGTNVIEIQSVELAGSESLRFVGGADDVWIVNVQGGFDLMNNAWVSSVPPGRLLLNMVGDNGGAAVTTSTGSVVNGIILGAHRKIFPQGRSGPVIGALSDEISIGSGAEIAATMSPVFPEPMDLTGDGKADIVRRNAVSGWVSMWEMDGNLPTFHNIGALPLNVEIVAIADLTGDGEGDIVRRNTDTGYVSMWEMDGNLPTYHHIGSLPLNVDIAGVADLTGDGTADIVRRNMDTGFVSMWEMDTGVPVYRSIGRLALNVEIVGVGDLNGDGMADIVRRNMDTGFVSMWEMDGNLPTYRNIGVLSLNVEIVGIGDLNGDGKGDIVRRNKDTGYVSMWEMDGNLPSFHGISSLSLNVDIVQIADLNNDDRADLVIRNSDTGYVSLWQMDGNVRTYQPVGQLPLSVEIQPPAVDEPAPEVTAVDDTVWIVPSDQPKVKDVLANDLPTGTLSISVLSSPAHGEVSLLPDNTVEYRQDGLAKESTGLTLYRYNCMSCHAVAGFTGTDSFTYTATNGVNSDSATVTVHVQSFDTSYSASDLSGYPMSVCADIAFQHATCRGLTDPDIAAIGRFLGEVFP